MDDTMIEATSQFEIPRPIPTLKRLAQTTPSGVGQGRLGDRRSAG